MEKSNNIFLLLVFMALTGIAHGAYITNWVNASEVLVVFNDSGTDKDGNGKADSRDVAEYYAARRGVPSQNLLAVNPSSTLSLSYSNFYHQILMPVYNKLETYDGSVKFKDKIFYILTCYEMPITVDVKSPPEDNPVSAGYPNNVRALDQFLIDIYPLAEGAYNTNGQPVYADGNRADKNIRRLVSRMNNATSPENMDTMVFKYFRPLMNTWLDGYYLTCRIDGVDAHHAKSLVDKAIYAEHYLKYQVATNHPYYIWNLMDTDSSQYHGHDYMTARQSEFMQGMTILPDGKPGYSPFATYNFTNEWYIGHPFDLILDNDRDEIGENGHNIPTLTARVESVSNNTITVKHYDPESPNTAYYFPVGKTVFSSGGGSAVVVETRGADKEVILDDATGFNVGDTVTWEWGGTIPISPMFIHTFYDLGAYRDVYTFPVGAFGKHMDSSSGSGIRWGQNGRWLAKALLRNITSSAGSVNEPFATGTADMSWVHNALDLGCDAVEAWYNGQQYNMHWMELIVSDPLYAPLRNFSSHTDDTVKPVIGEIRTVNSATTERKIEVYLGGTNEAAIDVCQFKVEYGADISYGNVYKYYKFDGPFNGDWNDDNRYFFSRDFSCTITGLVDGATYHYRVFAKDPYGNEAVTRDYTFTAGGTNTLLEPMPIEIQVDAGTNMNITLPVNTVDLNGTIITTNASVTSLWSKVSGVGIVTFGDVAAVGTTAQFSDAGTYVLSLSAYDGVNAPVTAGLTVDVYPVGGPTYTLTYLADEYGVISGVATQVVHRGENGTTVSVVADSGYHFSSWSDGITNAVRMETNVMQDISVTASFVVTPNPCVVIADNFESDTLANYSSFAGGSNPGTPVIGGGIMYGQQWKNTMTFNNIVLNCDHYVEADLNHFVGSEGGGLIVRGDVAGGNGYYAFISSSGQVELDYLSNGDRHWIKGYSGGFTNGPYRMRMEAEDNEIRVFIDGTKVVDATDSRYPNGSLIGAKFSNGGLNLGIDNLKAQALGVFCINASPLITIR